MAEPKPYATGCHDLDEEIFRLRARAEKAEQERDEAIERLKKVLGPECHGYMVEAPGEPLNMKFELACVKFKKGLEKAEQFREALIDALVIVHSYTAEHDANPRKAVTDLIVVETQIALDPAVSSDAQALIDRGKKEAEQENAKLREALAELVRLDDQYRPDPAPHEWARAWIAARTALGGE